jgi:hypothetical protein
MKLVFHTAMAQPPPPLLLLQVLAQGMALFEGLYATTPTRTSS